MEIRKELFDGIIDSFRHHLDLQDNHRVLFSGRFGIGKTTFLHHYFEQDPRYNVIYLYPVNYSVLDNEDIFSYIKYDILVTLLSNHDYPIKDDYYSFLDKWDDFLTDNLNQVIATAMLLIPKMGKQLNQFIAEFKDLKKRFDVVNKSKKNSELDELSDYLSLFYQAEGGIYETNVITLMIQEWLKDIEYQGKRNILIIDDLDRIDPHHIFRLLNIFSAHFDMRDKGDRKNKFGFDQVVMVCDITNIENIYRQQFGVKADFNGYVDKFYSKEIYRFDNDQNVLSIIQSILDRLQLMWTLNGETVEHSSGKNLKAYILPILKEMVLSRLVNLRSLFKFYDQSILLPDTSYRVKGEYVKLQDSYTLSSTYILALFIGDLRLLISKINLMPHLYLERSDHPHHFIAELITLHNNESIPRDMLYRGSQIPFEFNMTLNKVEYSGRISVQRPSSNVWTMPFSILSELKVDDEIVHSNQKPIEWYDAIDLFRETLTLIDK